MAQFSGTLRYTISFLAASIVLMVCMAEQAQANVTCCFINTEHKGWAGCSTHYTEKLATEALDKSIFQLSIYGKQDFEYWCKKTDIQQSDELRYDIPGKDLSVLNFKVVKTFNIFSYAKQLSCNNK